ncbi:MAG: hypothetical protein IT200_13530 [Thermoleophilia bacterium]|nr:hypothetical protein [Thermoleophilia bacterium]
MPCDPHHRFPDGLRALVGAGWHGTMLLRPAPGEPVTLACVAPASTLAVLQDASLAVGHHGAPRARPELVLGIGVPGGDAGVRHRVLLRPGSDHSDLRTLERLIRDASLDCALVASEPPHPVHVMSRDLEAAQLALLRDARAAASEWDSGTRDDAPPAARIPSERWRRAAGRCPCLVHTEGRAPGVAIVVPAEAVSGLTGRNGHVTLSSRLVHEPRATPEIALRVSWTGPDPVERWVRIPLTSEDGPTVETLAHQETVLVIGAGPDGCRSTTLCVRLCPDARLLLTAVAQRLA